MRIHIQQTEIENAIRDFIQKQGIRLQGKTVNIAFTATRSGAGITADIDVEGDGDAFMLSGTGVSEQGVANQRTSLSVVHTAEPSAATQAAAQVQEDPSLAPPAEPAAPAEVVEEFTDTSAAPAKTSSLFGS
jgi:hypothetical protein